jgi:hypothetical protein
MLLRLPFSLVGAMPIQEHVGVGSVSEYGIGECVCVCVCVRVCVVAVDGGGATKKGFHWL